MKNEFEKMKIELGKMKEESEKINVVAKS